MPDPLPILLLGRLAIDRRHHNRGLGRALLRDAMLRAVHVAGDAGVFAILVHALSEQAKRFYLSRGFVESPQQPMTLLMTLATVRSILAESE
jgi:GNAT superfamily N-acetyltransferase